MSAGSLFRLPRSWKQKQVHTDRILQSLSDLIPHAALIIDNRKQIILSANINCAEVTAYTRAELKGLKISTLFEAWDQGIVASAEDAIPVTDLDPNSNILTLIKRNQERVTVYVRKLDIDPADHQELVVFQTSPLFQQGEVASAQFWESLRHLLSSQQESHPDKAIAKALEASRGLLAADSAVLYQTREQIPELSLTLTVGKSFHFPKILPIQEMIYLNKPQIWTAGIRTKTDLTRAARAQNLRYLLTTPVGQTHALIGLVVFAGENQFAAPNALKISEFIGDVITNIIQHQAQIDKLNEEIRTRTRQETINDFLQASMSEGFLVLHPDLNIKELNQASELMFGYPGTEIVGHPVEQILIADKPLGPALNAAQNSSPTYNLGNIRLYRRNGESFLANIRIFPVIEAETVSEIIIYVQDLSEQEQMRRQAQEFEQRAVLGEVTAIFAHEIRNPINNISTGLQWMAYNLPPDDPNQEPIQRMLQDCDRLAELIKSVLSFSRPMDYEMEALYLPSIIDRLLNRLQTLITRANIRYELKFEPNCPEILGNQRALEQVFTNLIQNAIHAMEDKGGHLGIKIASIQDASDRSYLEVNIADTGPGIPKEDQQRIFQPFVTTKRGGTGLGLAISKRIITAHKGSIGLTSFPGGTVFRVKIPVIDTPPS